MTHSKSKGKYRPSLPAHLIAHIVDLAKKEIPMSTESIELIGILAPFMAKVENLAMAPAYTTTPKLSMFESIGGEVADASEPKEEYWYRCYLKLIAKPNQCSLKEIEAANEHRYLNGLMDALEMASFEENCSLVQPQAD